MAITRPFDKSTSLAVPRLGGSRGLYSKSPLGRASVGRKLSWFTELTSATKPASRSFESLRYQLLTGCIRTAIATTAAAAIEAFGIHDVRKARGLWRTASLPVTLKA